MTGSSGVCQGALRDKIYALIWLRDKIGLFYNQIEKIFVPSLNSSQKHENTSHWFSKIFMNSTGGKISPHFLSERDRQFHERIFGYSQKIFI